MKEVNTVPSEMELRHIEKDYLYQILEAQSESATPRDFDRLISRVKAKMEPEDVKLVLREFEEWKSK